jgi:hypothetical protein
MPVADKPDIDALIYALILRRYDEDALLEVLCAADDRELQSQAIAALVRILDRILKRDPDYARDLADTGIRSRALAIVSTLDYDNERNYNLVLARSLVLTRDLALLLDLDLDYDYVRGARQESLSPYLVGTPEPIDDLVLARRLACNIALALAHSSGDHPTPARTSVFLGDEFARQGVVEPAILYYEDALSESANVLEEEQAQEVQTKLEALKEYRRRSASYLTSIKHPRRLSKRLSSKFKIFIYPSEDRAEVEKVLREVFDDENWTGSVHPSGVGTGDLVVLKLWSADIEFSGGVVKRIEHDINQVTIGAKPKDTCHPGGHAVTLSISRKDTGEEISSVDFTVQVVDFAFDHVSRPLLSNVVSGVSGVFGAVAFVVTLLTDIDTALGLGAGTAALAVAAFFQARVWQLFRRPSTTVTP